MISKSFEKLGTKFIVKLPKEAFTDCFTELDRIEKKYSRFLETSILTKINNTRGWQKIDLETEKLILQGITYNLKTQGYFSLTVKSTLDKFGYDKEYTFRKKNTLTLPNVGKKLQLKKGLLKLLKPIDFGGLGKGYALDNLAKILDRKGIKKYFLNGGGDIKVKGEWKIFLEHPDDNTKTIGYVMLKDQAIASSSANKRNWGKYHHLINPKIGKPSNSDIKSLFVIATKAIDADAYATALFVMGYKKAKQTALKENLQVLIITKDDKLYQSKEFNATLY